MAPKSSLIFRMLTPCVMLLAGTTLLMLGSITSSDAISLEMHLRDDPDLSEFYSLIERDKAALEWVKDSAATVFAPTNQAFQRFAHNKTQLFYHFVNSAYKLDRLGDVLISNYEGNPQLYITRVRQPRYGDGSYAQDLMYVNNAKILRERSDMQFRNGFVQVLHVIDEVLVPVSVTPGLNKSYGSNPDAWEFLENVEAMNIEPHRVRSFRGKIISLNRQQNYRKSGRNTFLIPIESAFKSQPHNLMNMIDSKVIDGHIIPNKTIFIAPAPYGLPQQTMAFEDALRITVTFFRYGEVKDARVYVVSNTMYGNSRHTSGAVIAEVVKANIPVRNGVVHLIQRPLVVVNMKGVPMLTENNYFLWSKFRDLIEDYAPEFVEHIRDMSQKTIFVPHNDAVAEMMQTNFMSNRQKLREALLMHVVPDALTIELIRRNNQNHIFQIPTLSTRKFIYCNVFENRTSRTRSITIEGGGVNASVELGDIATMDGYIHVIDRMLGVPYMTVQKKLQTDPMLNLTYHFGILNRFNEQLNKTNKRFTYFVPRDKAWIQWFHDHPAASLEDFVRNYERTREVLQRHLVVADRVFTIGELRNMSYESLTLPTFSRDRLQIKVKEEDRRYYIQWKETGRWATVFRADVDCTNGLIHVIDDPFVLEEEVIVPGGTNGAMIRWKQTLEVTVFMTAINLLVAASLILTN
ncbi:AGAP000968-PA-like protein [Anopheles sinensis]|uniref:AGAP000968-PA-like protein n=1 Tax=Anopheles sinensis TaxID=74873 RepID=A0A084VN09_ANOSI|nr:AGAP000968-PA-like protein [Anopheles sinensis]